MRCGPSFLEKTIFKECYVTDRNINLMGPDWIDELNLIHSVTPEQHLIPDVVQRSEGNDQNIIPHVPSGLDGISLGRSRGKDGRPEAYESLTYLHNNPIKKS
ncbi:hypothetical protein ACTXT7_011023 [Hymenolepis weldensis]